MSPRRGIRRRTFLRAGAAGAVVASLGLWRLEGAPGTAAAAPPPSYGDWRDLYREKWSWDAVVRSSHWVNCWYQAHCAWNVYVKDGIVWREEQAADYPQTRPEVPDWNPRGCQKGACFSERMYDPARVPYPLERVGPRGSGRFRRISWDEALEKVADAILDTLVEEGSDRVVWDLGPGISTGVQTAGQARLRTLLDSTVLDMNTEIGDGHRGAAETFGKIVFERSADDYFFSDLILCWGANPAYTQIPNAHFLTEARYRGARLVCISPDHSATAIHSDLWIPVNPGGDAALALGVAHLLLRDGRVDEEFVREQTDLPLLVRTDTRRYLRESDLRDGGSDEILYLHDPKRGLVPAPRRSLDLGTLRPDLRGRFEATLADGSRVTVRPVFELLEERLREYTPERAAALSGAPAPLIRKLADLFAKARAASMVTTSNFAKYYHGNLVERSQALLFALTGHFGRKGTGFVGFPFLMLDSLDDFVLSMFGLPLRAMIGASQLVDEARLRMAGYTDEMIVYERSRRSFETGQEVSGALFWYIHGGLLEASRKLQDWDPFLKRPVEEVLRESLDKGWQHVWPKPGNPPRVLISLVSNPLRRIRCYPLLLEHLWPELRSVVVIDWRMTSTALHADLVLPAAAWYERTEHKWVTPLMPFIHGGRKVATFKEARSDWEIFSRLAEAIDRRASERGIREFVDRAGRTRSFEGFYRTFSNNGRFGHRDDEAVARELIEKTSNLAGVDFDALMDRGYARFTGVGESIASIGNATDIRPDDTVTPLTDHVEGRKPYPTLSRRIQFYLDQELYLELDEALPRHKAPPAAGGAYPLQLTGGHTRWSIHAAWRDDRMMLRQQRGEPVAWMSSADAAARGIRDGDLVRVRNDLDHFLIRVKVAPGVRPGQFIVYHAWENYQFRARRGFQNLIPSPLNPVELSGGQFHLRPMTICLQPSHTDRDTRVEVERA